jgi:hypothetical protein
VWEGGLDRAAVKFGPEFGRVWTGHQPSLEQAAAEFGLGCSRVEIGRRRWTEDRGRWTLDNRRVLLVEGAREGGPELADRFEYFRQ